MELDRYAAIWNSTVSNSTSLFRFCKKIRKKKSVFPLNIVLNERTDKPFVGNVYWLIYFTTCFILGMPKTLPCYQDVFVCQNVSVCVCQSQPIAAHPSVHPSHSSKCSVPLLPWRISCTIQVISCRWIKVRPHCTKHFFRNYLMIQKFHDKQMK